LVPAGSGTEAKITNTENLRRSQGRASFSGDTPGRRLSHEPIIDQTHRKTDCRRE